MPRELLPESGRRAVHELYLVKSLVHASEVLWAFRQPGETLRLRDVMDRTGFAKGMCFRLLYTLRHCGFIEKVEGNRYRVTSEIRRRKKYRIGYAGQGQDSSFADEVRIGLSRAAERAQVELVVVDNRYQPRIALKNAQLLIREGVDLVVEFQTDESVAPAIASAYHQARDPDHRHRHPASRRDLLRREQLRSGPPGRATAGALGEAALGRPRRRAAAARTGTRRIGARRPPAGRGRRRQGRAARRADVADHVDRRRWPVQDRARTRAQASARDVRGRILVGAANDPSALGAARAFQEAGRTDGCAIVGQNAEPDARAELRAEDSPLIASVGYFPERYGDGVIRLALDLLGRRAVPPAIFVKHQLVTRDNVDHLYPNDGLMGVETYARF